MNANKKTNKRKSDLLYPQLSFTIQGCIFEIRNQYGPGQKEVVYQRLLEEKLQSAHLAIHREKRINIYSQDSGKVVGTYQPDFIVEDKVIVEIKASRLTTKLDETQLYYYLRNSKYELPH